MRHTEATRKKVHQMRLRGMSLDQICIETKVPRTTVMSWIANLTLSNEQILALKKRTLDALQEGRIRTQGLKKKERLEKEYDLLLKGEKEIGQLGKREIFIAGIALYWAEGFKNKHEHRLGFCNSDPNMVRFYLHWLEKVLGVKKDDMIARLTLNASYKEKAGDIEKYWSELTGIPSRQFTKAFYQNTKWKKQFDNENYFGVLRIHVKNSLEYLMKMRGWIQGLKANLPG